MVTGDASHEIPGFSRLKKQHLQTGYRIPHLPSGKRLRNYGKPPFLMGKSTINGNFSIAMLESAWWFGTWFL